MTFYAHLSIISLWCINKSVDLDWDIIIAQGDLCLTDEIC